MTRCEECGVSVGNQHAMCPLCGTRLADATESETSYPLYAARRKGSIFVKAWLFMTVAAAIVTVSVNVFTFGLEPEAWSAIVCTALAYGWVTVRHTIVSHARLGDKIVAQLAALSAFLIALDALSGFEKWSTTYVIPFLSMGATLLIAIFAIIKRRSWHEYAGFLLSCFFTSLLPIAFLAFGLTTAAWTAFVSALFSIIVVAWLIVFNGASFRAEMRKRFHA